MQALENPKTWLEATERYTDIKAGRQKINTYI